MAITQRTVEEATKYIQDTIESWKSNGQDKKIISLSNWAEKWSSETGGQSARMRELQKNINALTQVVKRKRMMYPQMAADDPLELELEAHKNAYKDLVEKYGEPKLPKKRQIINLPKDQEVK